MQPRPDGGRVALARIGEQPETAILAEPETHAAMVDDLPPHTLAQAGIECGLTAVGPADAYEHG